MKITTITIDSIRSHAHTTINLDRLAVIRGSNHSGKSSIEQAIEFALAGRSEVTDEGGRGMGDLLRFGCDKGYVALEYEFDQRHLALRATLTAKGRDVGLVDPADKSWNPAAMLSGLQRSSSVLSCLCNTRYFVGLPPAKQKAILAGLILPQLVEFDEEMVSAATTAGIDVNWAYPPFAVIDSAYKQAFAARTLTGRNLKEFQLPEEPQAGGLSLEGIREKLAGLNKERDVLVGHAHELTRAYEVEQAKIAQMQSDAERTKNRVAGEQEHLGTLKAAALSDAKAKELTELAGKAKQGKILDDEIVFIRHDIETLADSLKKLDALGDGESACPTCEQLVRSEHIVYMAKPLLERKDKLTASLRIKQDERKALGDYESAAPKLEAHKQNLADQKAVAKRIATLEADLKSAAVPQSQLFPPDLSGIDAAIADLDGRIQKGNEALFKAGQQDHAQKRYATAKEQRGLLQAQMQRLEALCKYFGPSDEGIKAKLIAEHIGSFEASINWLLNGWGYVAALSIEPYGFQVARAGERESTCQLHQLSASETFRFSVAFQVALAMHSGYKFVIVDAADILDEASERKLYGTLYKSQLDQAIVMSTSVDTRINPLPGTVFYMLHETPQGTTVERLGVQEAVMA